jgi:hypothetical protein
MAHPQEWRVNVTQLTSRNGKAIDGTDADELSAGEIDGRRQVLAFFQFLKREAPGFADSYIVDIPPQIGIRETRRVTGRYQLSGDDVVSCASFADTTGLARIQSPALSHAGAAPAAQPAGRRALRLHDP